MKHLQIFKPSAEMAAIEETSNMIVDKLSTGYIDIISKMIGKSETTKRTYRRNVEHFLSFIQSNGINSHSFGEYREALAKVDRISVKTKNAYLSAASALLRESLKYGVVPVDITSNVPHFKISTKHVKDGLTATEVRRVLEHIKSITTEVTRQKMNAMFYLFAMEGLRQAELQQLKVDDVNIPEAYIMILRKGAHDKEKFFIMDATSKAIQDYINAVGISDGWLFPSPKDGPVSLRAIRKYFTCPKYGIFAKCGITGKSVHGFRHYNITKTLQVYNGNLEKTRQRSGHANHSMLVVYNDERLNRSDVADLEAGFMFAPN